jgi:hypothetical protein
MATQGSQANAKDSTLYYAERAGGAFSVLATDLSQYADNQTAGASWTTEASPASRFNVTDYWCVEVEVDCDNTDTGRFVQYGTTASSSTIALRYGNTAGVVDAIMSSGGVGTVVGQLTLPDVSGSDQRFVIAWAVEPNPLTTGAADAMRSELRAWNITAGTYAQSVFTHFARTAGTSDFVWWALSSAGSSAFTGTPHMCRFSSGRFITATETAEDFVATTSAPTITGQTRLEFPIVEPGNALADPGEFVGPAVAMAAASVASMDLRTLSPLVDENFLERPDLARTTFAGMPEHWTRSAPLANYVLLGDTFMRPISPRVDRIKVRVNLQQWRVGAGDDNRIHLRVWSMNRPPQPVGPSVVDHDAALVAYSTADAYLETDHGSGAAAGEWLDLGLCQVARNSAGRTWIVLGAWLEDVSAEGLTDDNRIRIHAMTVDPVLAA